MNINTLRRIVVCTIGITISILLLILIFNFYKYVFIHYCLYKTSNIILLNATMYGLVSLVTIFPMTIVLLPLITNIITVLMVCITILVKRK